MPKATCWVRATVDFELQIFQGPFVLRLNSCKPFKAAKPHPIFYVWAHTDHILEWQVLFKKFGGEGIEPQTFWSWTNFAHHCTTTNASCRDMDSAQDTLDPMTEMARKRLQAESNTSGHLLFIEGSAKYEVLFKTCFIICSHLNCERRNELF